ncbi:ABC transporter permease [Granulicatella sp. zg-ZJ]|uniref:ABC transporter permease n=1 Tax=Granulicatella sp. zg-ZJ TaxID=2678504 RepID=UPI0019670106|nr:ABC transporter permease [Granulicatella sp. zg-ZJ]
MKKLSAWSSVCVIVAVIIIWEIASRLQWVPEFMLPSFTKVTQVFLSDFSLLQQHFQTTLYEALIGLFISTCLGVLLAFLMDYSTWIQHSLYPILVLSQTIPTISLAPLLVLWFGYGLMPKIILITLVCFFPMTMNVFTGLKSIDTDYLTLLTTMQATHWQKMKYVKIPFVLPAFFTGLKIATSYAVVGAVISEWLGGDSGLGVYMTRVRKSFAFDKMFAVILLTSIFSLLLVGIVTLIEKKVLHYQRKSGE